MWLLLGALCLARGLRGGGAGVEAFRNPETFMNISQKIVFHGYPSELYEVMTEDGYFLTLNRIPHGRRDRTRASVLHGFCQDGGDWVDNFPDNSLAFILADAGYDVWLGNNRGNSWSRRHQNLSVDSVEFWDFSFHEMAMYDLPAMVGFILMQTEQEKLFYVGHAQGTLGVRGGGEDLPHLAKKIKLFFALAPVSTLRYARGPVLRTYGSRELVLVKRKDRDARVVKCSRRVPAERCAIELFLAGGFDRENLNVSRLDVYLSHFPDYTSVKNLLHWGQEPGEVQPGKWDWGCSSPSQRTPPFYKIEDMKVPVALWSGDKDWVSPPEEVHRLLPRLSNTIYHEHYSNWNHFDHHWGLNAPQRLYTEMMALMEENP
uniref:Lipase n=1 Tax=Malurus cyaneus samueli TaxID=2593467 RepID=A0A8C5TWL7_9PASS